MKITQVTSNVEKQQISLSFDAPPWTVRNSNVELGVKAVLEELPYFIEIISVQWNDVGYIVRLDFSKWENKDDIQPLLPAMYACADDVWGYMVECLISKEAYFSIE